MTPAVATFLRPLSSSDQSAVMAMARPWTAPAESRLFTAGEPVPGLWLLDEGLVRYEVLDADGRQIVPAFSAAGTCFGEVEVLEGRPAIVTGVTALPCEGWVLSADSALEALDAVPAFGKLMLMKLARNVRLSQMLYHVALMLGQRERLALALLNLGHEETCADGHGVLVVPLTQETLCQVTGSSRQLVSKCLRQWADQGWVAPRYRSLAVLDPQGLKSIFPASVNPELFGLLYRVARRPGGPEPVASSQAALKRGKRSAPPPPSA